MAPRSNASQCQFLPVRLSLVCCMQKNVHLCLLLGTACIHSGLTLHYSRGNFGPLPSSAYIINFRPEAMVEYERTRGFDHGRYSHAGTDSLE